MYDNYHGIIMIQKFRSLIGLILLVAVTAGAHAQNSLTPDASFLGTHSYERVGYHLHRAGDVNGDGFGDFLIGTFHNRARGHDAGAVYLMFGKRTPDWGRHFSLKNADARFTGDREYDAVGYCIGGGGDVNGDGFDDILIGAPAGNEVVITNPGHIYIVFGKEFPNWGYNFRLADDADASFDGEEQHNFAGLSLAIIGDVNQDGYDDILCGSPYNDFGNTDGGKAHLILGKPGGWGRDINLNQADASFFGKRNEGLAGYAVDGVGDVNGDGIVDFAIGARGEAKVYLIYGRKEADWGLNFDLEDADVIFASDQSYDWAGWRVSRAGDVNRDGFGDFLVGAPLHNGTRRDAGRVSLILGRADGWRWNLSDADANFYGEDLEDQAGWDVQDAGDVDGDGFDDFLIGAWKNDAGGEDAGKVYLIKGRKQGWQGNIPLSEIETFYVGAQPGVYAGFSVASAGDVTGNGVDDIIASSTYDSEVSEWSGKVNLFINENDAKQIALPVMRIPKNFLADIPVLVDDLSEDSVRSYEFQVKFENHVIEPVGVKTENSLTEMWDQVDINTDTLGIFHVQASGTPALANGDTLIKLIFRITGEVNDTSLLQFQYAKLNDGEIPCATIDGRLIVEPPVAPPPAELVVGVNSLPFGTTHTSRIFRITNTTDSLLNWQVDHIDKDLWDVSIQPADGILDIGESELITVAVDRALLDRGDYIDSLRFIAEKATNCPKTIPITLSARTWPIQIGHYRLFETEFISEKISDNPYIDESFAIQLKSPTGREIAVSGYWYDGKNWKCRIMPTEVGKWTYLSSSDDPGLDGIAGEFLCIASDHPGMLTIDESNPYGFALSESGPIYWMGETSWCLMSNAVPFSDGTFQQYIDTRKAQGFNNIHFVLGTGGLPIGTDNPENEGGNLWLSRSEDRINPEFFKWMDKRVAYLDSSELALGFFITWAQHFATFSLSEYERLERYLISRYSAYPLLHWVVAGEFDEAGSTDDYNYHGSLIKNTDPYGHLVSIHPGHSDAANLGTNRIFAEQEWCDYVMQQLPRYPGHAPPSEINEQVVVDRVYDKPVVNIEFGYEEMDYLGRVMSADDMRRYAWAVACGGGFSSYGHSETIRDVQFDVLEAPGVTYFQHLMSFFDKLNWWNMAPLNEIVESGFCLAKENERYIIYFPDSGRTKVDFTKIEGMFRGEWFNPETGEVQSAPYGYGGERNSFESPFEDDAVLHLWAVSDYGIKAEPDTLRFVAIQGGAIPSGQTVTISQIGEGALAWMLETEPLCDWIEFDVNQGGAGEQFTVTVEPNGLAVGNYRTEIRVNDPKAVNSPVVIPVFFKVNPPKIPRLAVSEQALDFGEIEDRLEITVTNAGNDSLLWHIDEIEYPWINSVRPSSGLLVEGDSEFVSIEVNREGLASDDYLGNLRISSNGGTEDVEISMIVPELPAYLQRINCGSSEGYIDARRNEWSADQAYQPGAFGFVGGRTYSSSDSVAGTQDDPLYQSERYGVNAYQFDIPEGRYTVVLHFAEIYFRSAERRLMRIAIEGNELLERLDIFEEAGHDVALIYSFPNIAVRDGRLDITFESIYEQPKISAIEVFSASTTPQLSVQPAILDFGAAGTSHSLTITNSGGGTLAWNATKIAEHAWIKSVQPEEGILSALQSQIIDVTVDRNGLDYAEYESVLQIESNAGDRSVPITMIVAPTPKYAQRINCGASENFEDSAGLVWSADKSYASHGFGYDGGQTFTVTDPISGTANNALYQSERWGLDAYRFDVPDGNYTVVLHFAEIYFSRPKQRVMDISIEGEKVVSRLDVFERVGHDVSFQTTFSNVIVDDGRLDIDFRGVVEEPKISAIEVYSGSDEPLLSVKPGEINFGSTQNIMNLIVTNAGGGSLDWSASEMPDQEWITSIAPPGGSLEEGSDTVRVMVSRDGLEQGEYLGNINFTSNGGNQDIDVNLVVPGPPALSVSPKRLNFGENSTWMEFTITNAGGGTLHWSSIQEPELVWISSIAPADDTLIADQSVRVQVAVQRSGLSEGDYHGKITIDSNAGSDTIAVEMTVSAKPAYEKRINCGGKNDYVDRFENTWLKDTAYSPGGFGYVGGKTYSAQDSIAETLDDNLYQSERYGLQAYWFDVQDGLYNVVLHFAEIYFKESKRRLFGVSVENERVVNELDIFQETGHDVALKYVFPNVSVNDGRLDIQFHNVYEQPKISAIEVMSASSDPSLSVNSMNLDFGGSKTSLDMQITNSGGGALNWIFEEKTSLDWLVSVEPTQGMLTAGQTQKAEFTIDRTDLEPNNYSGKINLTSNGGDKEIQLNFTVLPPVEYVLRVNCGSTLKFVDVDGNEWSADQKFDFRTWGFIGGGCYETDDEMMGTDDDALFQSERWGLDGYAFQVENGFYEVTLLFAEIYFSRANKRKFHVDIEGSRVLTGFDIFAEAGYDQALLKTFQTTVTDGELNINFRNEIEDAKISAIQVLGFEGNNLPKFVPDSTLTKEMRLPDKFQLFQNYPNPFNPSTHIQYQIPEHGKVTMQIFNVLGEQVCTLVNEVQPPGNYTVDWNIGSASSGVYFCRIMYKNHVKTIKMSKLQ